MEGRGEFPHVDTLGAARGSTSLPRDSVRAGSSVPIGTEVDSLAADGLLVERPVLGEPALGLRHACPCCNGAGVVPLPLDGPALLKAIARDFGTELFTTAELINHARLIDGPLRPLLEDYSPHSVGKALAALDGKACDGLLLEKMALERGRVAIWRVLVLPV